MSFELGCKLGPSEAQAQNTSKNDDLKNGPVLYLIFAWELILDTYRGLGYAQCAWSIFLNRWWLLKWCAKRIPNLQFNEAENYISGIHGIKSRCDIEIEIYLCQECRGHGTVSAECNCHCFVPSLSLWTRRHGQQTAVTSIIPPGGDQVHARAFGCMLWEMWKYEYFILYYLILSK